MHRVFRTSASLFGVGLAFAVAQRAAAQSLDIPLQLSESTGGVRLIINVGIGGQGPLPYLFDTGSAGFVAAYSASAFGNVPSNMSAGTPQYSNGLPTGVSISYSSNNTYTGNFVAVPSLTFYPTASTPVGSSSSVTLNAVTRSGSASNFIIDAAYSRNNVAIPVPLQSIPGVFQGIYGIFGVGEFAFSIAGSRANSQPGVTPNTTTATIGGVLGQAVVPGTTAGYVIAANGQALNGLPTGSGTVPGATVNGPQVGVGQNVTSCNPCVMLGLTPALIAQFRIRCHGSDWEADHWETERWCRPSPTPTLQPVSSLASISTTPSRLPTWAQSSITIRRRYSIRERQLISSRAIYCRSRSRRKAAP
jgi:hypothetical protein